MVGVKTEKVAGKFMKEIAAYTFCEVVERELDREIERMFKE
jgi:hypothetical protein